MLNGKQNVFFTTNNALKNAVCNLHLLVRKKVKEVRWLNFAEVIFHSFRILNRKKKTLAQNPRKLPLFSYNHSLLHH